MAHFIHTYIHTCRSQAFHIYSSKYLDLKYCCILTVSFKSHQLFQGFDLEDVSNSVVKDLLAQTAQYMPVKKIMDPSKTRVSSSVTLETNNLRNPSSSNKNKIVSTPRERTGVNATSNGDVKKEKSKKTTGKISVNLNVTKNAQPKVQKEAKAAPPLGEGEVEVPKISRREKIQNKLEKRIKAAEENGTVYVAPVRAAKPAPPVQVTNKSWHSLVLGICLICTIATITIVSSSLRVAFTEFSREAYLSIWHPLTHGTHPHYCTSEN